MDLAIYKFRRLEYEGNYKIDELHGKDTTFIQMDLNILETLKMIVNMVMEKSLTKMI